MQKINPPWELHLGIRKVLPAKLSALRWNLAGLKPESVLHGREGLQSPSSTGHLRQHPLKTASGLLQISQRPFPQNFV
jgi:hypothetical protein